MQENPGGEFRKSYHGYPSGFAQLLHSPRQWVVEPMQIDTHPRHYNLTQTEGYRPWFLPAMVSNNMTDEVSGLNPLIECPCTDRITKSTKASTNIIVKGTCRSAHTSPHNSHQYIKLVSSTIIDSEAACEAAVEAAGATIGRVTAASDPSLPSGCLLQPSKPRAGLKMAGGAVAGPVYDVTYNNVTR